MNAARPTTDSIASWRREGATGAAGSRCVNSAMTDGLLPESLIAEALLADGLLAERLLAERLLAERLLAERLLAEGPVPQDFSMPWQSASDRSMQPWQRAPFRVFERLGHHAT